MYSLPYMCMHIYIPVYLSIYIYIDRYKCLSQSKSTSTAPVFFNEVLTITPPVHDFSQNFNKWNKSLYCSFNQFRRESVIAFTFLLLLKLSLISTLQIEYCHLPAPVVNWWERKRLNYPGDFTEERGTVALIRLHGTGAQFSVLKRLLPRAFFYFFGFNSEIAPDIFAEWVFFIKFQSLPVKPTSGWSFSVIVLTHIMQHFQQTALNIKQTNATVASSLDSSDSIWLNTGLDKHDSRNFDCSL